MPARPLLACCLALLVARGLVPARSAADGLQERLATEAREQEADMRARGVVLDAPGLDAYLQQVLERLFPLYEHAFHAHVYRSLDANAFALPGGGIYVDLGLLLRLRDESELAAVLAHEGMHVVAGHATLEEEHRRVAGIVATGIGAALGVPPDAFGIRRSSILGYSRELESAADRGALDGLRAAGYDANALARVLARLAAEDDARGVVEVKTLHSDHPGLLERTRALEALGGREPGGESSEARFRDNTRAERRLALADMVALRDGPLLLAQLAAPAAADEFGELGHYALAEGYRLRARPGDEALALAEYARAIEMQPQFAAPYGARGRLLEKRGERVAALADLQRFVDLAGDTRDAEFARQRITRLRQEIPP